MQETEHLGQSRIEKIWRNVISPITSSSSRLLGTIGVSQRKHFIQPLSKGRRSCRSSGFSFTCSTMSSSGWSSKYSSRSITESPLMHGELSGLRVTAGKTFVRDEMGVEGQLTDYLRYDSSFLSTGQTTGRAELQMHRRSLS